MTYFLEAPDNSTIQVIIFYKVLTIAQFTLCILSIIFCKVLKIAQFK
jgi:hypothetical protein